MDYNDKLRLAKEALESGSYDRETIEYIFPELAESEDEKIRKEIINYFYDAHEDDEERARFIAWLEKQKIENPYKRIIGEGYSSPVSYGKELEALMDEAFRILQDGYSFSDAFYAGVKAQQSLEQKPVEWSDIDNMRLREAIQMVESNGSWVRSKDAVKLVSDWLKSLKDRVVPQPKQEWTEEEWNEYYQHLADIEDEDERDHALLDLVDNG